MTANKWYCIAQTTTFDTGCGINVAFEDSSILFTANVRFGSASLNISNCSIQNEYLISVRLRETNTKWCVDLLCNKTITPNIDITDSPYWSAENTAAGAGSILAVINDIDKDFNTERGSGGESLWEKINVGTEESPIWAVKPKDIPIEATEGQEQEEDNTSIPVGVLSDTFITAGGRYNGDSGDSGGNGGNGDSGGNGGNGGNGGGSGASFNRLDDWANYDETAGDVLSALLGYGLKQDIEALKKSGTLDESKLKAYLDKYNYLTKAAADLLYAPINSGGLWEKVNIGTEEAPVWAVRPKDIDNTVAGIVSDTFITAGGRNGNSSEQGTATTLGGLINVDDTADELQAEDMVLVKGVDATHWTLRSLSTLGLNKTELESYLTTNSYLKKDTADGLYAPLASFNTLNTKVNDFLTGTDTDSIINKWKELEAFLAGQTETSTLADLLAVKADKTALQAHIDNYNYFVGTTYAAHISAYNTHIADYNTFKTDTQRRLNALEALWAIDEENNGLYPKSGRGIWSESYITAGGIGTSGEGSGGGGLVRNVYGYGDLGGTFSNTNLTDTFNAYTINYLYTEVEKLKSGSTGFGESAMWAALGGSAENKVIAATHIPDLSGKYLPLSGGAMNTGAYIAWQKNVNGNDVTDWDSVNGFGLRIISDGGSSTGTPTQYATALHIMGRYGFQLGTKGGNNDTFYIRKITPSPREWQTLIHSGNIGEQLVESASTFRLRIGDSSPSVDLNTLNTGGIAKNYVGMSKWVNAPDGMLYGAALNIKARGYKSLQGQLAWDVVHASTTDTTRFLWWRASDDGTFTEAKWHQIAFTDSNVASATKLQDNTAYTAWGQTFFENGTPKNITSTSNLIFSECTITPTNIIYASRGGGWVHNVRVIKEEDGAILGSIGFAGHGDGLSRAYIVAGDTSSTNGLIVLGSGYVGIGTNSPAYKLDVAGSLNATTIYQNGQTLDKYYLPLTGGVLKASGKNNPLIVRSDGHDYVRIGFGVETNGYASLVYSGGLDWQVTSEGWGSVATLIHSGNIGSYNAGSATKLANKVKLWGNEFDGSADVTGSITLPNNVSINVTDTSGVSYSAFRLYSSNNLQIGQDTAKVGYNTYIYGNEIRLAYGTTGTISNTALMVNSSGYVGIGTTAPEYTLDVAGPIRTIGALIANSAKITTNIRVGEEGIYNYIATRTAEKYYNLSIDSHGDKICISGQSNTVLNVNYTKSESGWAPKKWNWYNGSSTGWANFELGGVTANGEIILADSTGSSSISHKLRFLRKTSTDNSYDFGLYAQTTKGLTFFRNLAGTDTDIAYLDYAGNFNATGGITATALTINGVGKVAGNLTTTNIYPDADASYNLGSTAKRWYQVHTQGLHTMTIYADSGLQIIANTDVSGNIYATGAITAGSDARYKSKLQDVAVDVEVIADAPLFDFVWNDGRKDKKTYLGTTAQYWAQTNFKNAVIPTDNEKLWTMSYSQIAMGNTIVLARELLPIKRKVREIDDLKSRLHKAEKKIEVLENELKQYRRA